VSAMVPIVLSKLVNRASSPWTVFIMGATTISCSEIIRSSASSALTTREVSRDTASASTPMERPQHSLPKSDTLHEFMSYSTDTRLMIRGTCDLIRPSVSWCRPSKQPPRNDETSRLTNDFNLIFLFFAASHHKTARLGERDQRRDCVKRVCSAALEGHRVEAQGHALYLGTSSCRLESVSCVPKLCVVGLRD
jgi:hypothetical protein